MADIRGIELASEIYGLEDTSARNTATAASQTATQASQTATQAGQTAIQASQDVDSIQDLIPSSASSNNKLVVQSELKQTVTPTLTLGYGISVKKSGHTVFVSWALNANSTVNVLPQGTSRLATGLPKPVAVSITDGASPSVPLDNAGGSGAMRADVRISVNSEGVLNAYNNLDGSINSAYSGAYLVYYTDE